jgi:pantoate--beta-alanine ligase
MTQKLPRPVVLVPTMGALHQGHLALVARARRLAGRNGSTVATVFVNPIQFGPNEDLGQYPRRFRADCAKLRERECDIVFAPRASDMYADDRSVIVTESNLASVMCGASRPGHFSGVCTVVAKLFNLLGPDVAVFGEKDFQQIAIIKRMVRDLNFPVRIVSHPTVRERDGLALSSRNAYLSREERSQAPVIYEALTEAAAKVRAGFGFRRKLEPWIRRKIERMPLARVDYAVVVDPETLQPKSPTQPPLLLAAAVYFGRTRLIDNQLVK